MGYINAAFDWGRSIGEVRRLNSLSKGTAKGTGLRGRLRESFEQGLSIGFNKPRCWQL